MVHAKTATIDGNWTTIGTANVDRLSMTGNYEINVEIIDASLAEEMERIFETDLTNALPLTLAEWEARDVYSRFTEMILHAAAAPALTRGRPSPARVRDMDDASPDQDLLRQSRRAWGALETVHVIGYFAEETTAEYVALGLHDRLAYFPARAAAMGAVGPRAHRGHLLRLRAVAARRRPARCLGHGQPGADGAGAARRHGQGPGPHPRRRRTWPSRSPSPGGCATG